jgi:hypothetical protein
VIRDEFTDMVIQKIDIPAAGTSLKKIFDFKAKQLTTDIVNDGRPLPPQVQKFADVDAELLKEIEKIRADAGRNAGPKLS